MNLKINDNILFNLELYQVSKINKRFVYLCKYDIDKKQTFSNDIVFETAGHTKKYIKFSNLSPISNKFNISSIKDSYFKINDIQLNNNYFIINSGDNSNNCYVIQDYDTSIFKNDVVKLHSLHQIYKFFRNYTGRIMNNNSEYYINHKLKLLNEFIQYIVGVDMNNLLNLLDENKEIFINNSNLSFLELYQQLEI